MRHVRRGAPAFNYTLFIIEKRGRAPRQEKLARQKQQQQEQQDAEITRREHVLRINTEKQREKNLLQSQKHDRVFRIMCDDRKQKQINKEMAQTEKSIPIGITHIIGMKIVLWRDSYGIHTLDNDGKKNYLSDN